MGMQPAAGRLPAVFEAGAVLISEAVAIAEYGSAGAALGQSVRVAEIDATVVGVAPAGFAGPDLERVDIWHTLDQAEAGNTNWWIAARLPDTGSRISAMAEAQTIHDATDPGRFFQWARDGRVAMSGVDEDPTGERTVETSIAVLLLAVVALVLVISWVNVLNLLYARMARREGEILVRVALGIGRWQLIRLMLTECLLLSLLGGAASVPVAYAQGALVRDVLLPDVAWASSTVNVQLLAVTFMVVLVSGALLGLLLARQADRADVSRGLAESRQTPGGARSWRQTALVTGQITLSAAMLLCAGLFVKSFWTMRVTDLGIDAETVHVVDLRSLGVGAGGGGEAEEQLYAEAVRALREAPAGQSGGRQVAMAIGLPFVTGFGMSVYVDGLDEIPELPGGGPFIHVVSDGYFATVGTDIMRGEAISALHIASEAQVTVIGESTAAALWPAGNAIGQCARIGGPEDQCYEVIGIAEDVHQRGYREPPSMVFYLPFGVPKQFFGPSLVVRSSRGGLTESALAAEISRAVPGVDYVEVRRLDTFLEAEIRPWKLGAVMLSMVAVLAIIMSLAGVFGVLTYVVAQRRREIGVRMALGATAGAVRGLVLRRGVVTGIVGVALGFAAVLVGSRWLTPLLFETPVGDPLVMGLTGLGLVLSSVGACLLPAVQASRVDPASSLRADA
ncbi:MAG: FtsX-like permease family protein [Acidobacteria bacterium]|nr:FtsX-like permease family protein [Acidobacteriota bacterium]